MKKNAGKYLKYIEIFDVYEGKSIEKDKRSMAFSLKFQADDRTLLESDINSSITSIINAVEQKFAAVLRKS